MLYGQRAGDKRVTLGTDPHGSKTGHSVIPKKDLQAGWRAQDGSDPRSRRLGPHMSGDFSAAGKANQKNSVYEESSPSEEKNRGH